MMTKSRRQKPVARSQKDKAASQKSGAGMKEKRICQCGFSLIFWLLTPDS
jgi:hypothetical protein